jgi:hypothetical protein
VVGFRRAQWWEPEEWHYWLHQEAISERHYLRQAGGLEEQHCLRQLEELVEHQLEAQAEHQLEALAEHQLEAPAELQLEALAELQLEELVELQLEVEVAKFVLRLWYSQPMSMRLNGSYVSNKFFDVDGRQLTQ